MIKTILIFFLLFSLFLNCVTINTEITKSENINSLKEQKQTPCEKRSKKLAFIFTFTLGFAGVDRFYCGIIKNFSSRLVFSWSFENFIVFW
jgi:hypothetical protein